ncbi:hypothetical protein SMIDD26_01915 [Streptococcus mitis]|uniref:Uncharacterized protein n=1 Tax=Streptococcus mitis TaxID=28037 RepID=A0A139PKH1_STRMT|nr:hypothetical protein SMIDD26_01915 [Streptococcus mitis]
MYLSFLHKKPLAVALNMTVAGIEPAGLAVKRTLGKSFKETQTTC